MKILPNNIAVIEGDTHISKWVEETGRLDHDQNTLPYVLPHIREGDWVIDGGAFIGDHTIAYAKAVGPTGKVFAFELNSEAYQCLAWNLDGKAQCFQLGLSHHGKTWHYERSDNAGATHVVPKETGNIAFFVTIDALELPRCDFIKLDIEGYEHRALMGGYTTIKRYRPKMLIEINRHALARWQRDGVNPETPEDIYRFLGSLNYSYAPIWPDSKLTDEQLDILCIPK